MQGYKWMGNCRSPLYDWNDDPETWRTLGNFLLSMRTKTYNLCEMFTDVSKVLTWDKTRSKYDHWIRSVFALNSDCDFNELRNSLSITASGRLVHSVEADIPHRINVQNLVMDGTLKRWNDNYTGIACSAIPFAFHFQHQLTPTAEKPNFYQIPSFPSNRWCNARRSLFKAKLNTIVRKFIKTSC